MMMFQANQLRNSPFGYNDELAYAVLGGINVGLYILRHISPNNYNFAFDQELYRIAPHHEFTHLLLGLSFMKRSNNPLPFEYAYDGNNMAEALVIHLQDQFKVTDPQTISQDDYIERLKAFYQDGGIEKDIDNTTKAAILLNRQNDLRTIFDMRRTYQFESIPADDISKEDRRNLSVTTQFGEKVISKCDLDIPEEVAINFYDDVQPITRLVQRNYRRLVDDPNFNFIDCDRTFKSYLRMMPVNIIWEAMNNPDRDFDLDHRDLITWEFCLQHDPDFNFFPEIAGMYDVRQAIGYEKLSQPIGYDNYRGYKENIGEINTHFDQIGKGFLVVQATENSGNDFLSHLRERLRRRSEINMNLARVLINEGPMAFIVELERVLPFFRTHASCRQKQNRRPETTAP